MTVFHLEVPESQIVEWVANLSPDSKKKLLRSLIPRLDDFDSLVDRGEEQIRSLSKERGVDWGALSEDERMKLVDHLLHEA